MIPPPGAALFAFAALAGLPVTFGGGLRVDLPDDAAPPVYGLGFEGRLSVLPEAYIGAELTYGGGPDTRNDTRLRAYGKGELAATLGFLGDLDAQGAWAVGLGARGGVVRVDGWPRGTLPALSMFGPLIGAEGRLAWRFDRTREQSVALELGVGFTRLRLDNAWTNDPGVGLSLTWSR